MRNVSSPILPLLLTTLVMPALSQARPVGLIGHAMGYDSARGRLVVHGGPNQTWEWDSCCWQLIMTTTGPASISGHTVCYDAARGEIVLFGGDVGGTKTNRTWTWDGTGWTLHNNLPASPPARDDHTMVYDSIRQVCLLFGGTPGNGTVLGDTWEWNGTYWTNRTPVGSSPSARDDHAMTFDTQRGVAVLFGGLSASGVMSDTWEWNGSTWTNVTPQGQGVSPSARGYAAMAFDPNHGSILYGGNDAINPSSLSDTWIWNGANGAWSLHPATAGPLYSHAMAYDSARSQVVISGGASAGLATNSDWVFNGTSWFETTSTPTNYGTGTPHSGGTPTISASQQPSLGCPWTLEAANTGPAVSGYFLLNLAPQAPPLVIPCSGSRSMSVHVGLIGAVQVAVPVSGAETSEFTMSIPNAPVFAGVHIYSQYFSFLPSPSSGACFLFPSPFLGFAASDGLDATIW